MSDPVHPIRRPTRSRRAAALCSAALLAALPTLSPAETVIANEASKQRGQGSLPEIFMDGGDLVAAMRDDDDRFVMLHYRVQEDGRLTGGHKSIGRESVDHDVIHTLLNTPVSATLHRDGDSASLGALTIDTFELRSGQISHLDVHRAPAEAGDGGGGGGIVVGGRTSTAGTELGVQDAPLVVSEGPTRSRGPIAGGNGGVVSPDHQPGLYAREVAIEDVSRVSGHGDIEAERVVTAIIDEEGELQLDTWALDERKRVSHIDRNTQAGEATKVSLVPWNKGVVTALIDAEGRARFVAWEITAAGDIVRRGTVTADEASDVAVARFSAEADDDRYVAVIRRTDNRVRAVVFELGASGASHAVVAQGLTPDDATGRATAISVGHAAKADDDALRRDTIYSASRDTAGYLRLIRWRVDGDDLVPHIRKRIDERVLDVAMALEPFAPSSRDDADTFGTVVRKLDGSMQVDLWSSYFRDLFVGDDLQDPGHDWTPGLLFSENSPANTRFGREYPEDMPEPRMPTGYHDCTVPEEEAIREAWTHGHYMAWRAQQAMTWLAENPEHREAAWSDTYNHTLGTQAGGYTNHAPRAWFGRYDAGRFDQVRRTMKKAWDQRFRGKTFTVQCRSDDSHHPHHICHSERDPSANHIVYGTINFCDNFFEPNRSIENRARTVVHEVYHWLKVPESVFWVTDNHDFWERCGLGGYHAVSPLYGDEIAYIANNQGCNQRNYRRAIRSNDAYAYFARELGRRVYDGTVDAFPSPAFWD